MRLWLAGCLGAALFVGSGPAAPAQSYPTHPVRLVVPYAPGGVLDYSGRLLAKALGDRLGQQVVVDNRPGAGGVIGTDTVVHAAADGYTLLLMDPALAVNPSLQKSVPYDVLNDLQPISMINTSPLVAAVNAATPVTTIAALISYAKAHPGGLTFGSAGVGTTPHMAGELFKLKTGTPLIHVAYKGIGPAIADLIAGQIDLCFASITGALPHITDGKLRGLATTGLRRSSALPDLPTVAEAGVADFEVDLWLMLLAPARLPAPLVERLNRETHEALTDRAVVEGFARVGAEPLPTSPEAARTFLAAELGKWAQVVTAAHLQAN